jgi:hypothetical protein
MTAAAHFEIPAHVHARRFDDELVVLHLGAGAYFSLDAVGTLIWEQIVGGKTIDETIASLLAEFEVDELTARADVQRLAAELVDAGLLTQRP